MNKVLVLGKTGQLGSALAAQLGGEGVVLGRRDADLYDSVFTRQLDALADKHEPLAVFNAAGYTQVDAAEEEGGELAWRINHAAVAELAHWCAARGLPLVHFSTDYVFDGTGDRPYREDDMPNPINVYGQTKLAGERAVAEADGKHLVLRTSWLYGAHGRNFFNAILDLLGQRDRINVVADQVGAPTYAPHLAQASLAALKQALGMKPFPSGIYHLCAGGHASRHGFAEAIFTLARSRDSGEKSYVVCRHIEAIPSSGYPLSARRLPNSRLDCEAARAMFGVALPSWEAGLEKCFEEKYGHSGLHAIRSQKPSV